MTTTAAAEATSGVDQEGVPLRSTNQQQEPELKGEGSARIVEQVVRDPAGHLRVERSPAWLPSEAETDKAFASLGKAWPILATHADWMDGEFSLALSDLRNMVAILRLEIAHLRASPPLPQLVPASHGRGSTPTPFVVITMTAAGATDYSLCRCGHGAGSHNSLKFNCLATTDGTHATRCSCRAFLFAGLP